MKVGDFVEFKCGKQYLWGRIDKIDGEWAEVSYNSRSNCKRFISRFGKELLPQGLEYFCDEPIANLKN